MIDTSIGSTTRLEPEVHDGSDLANGNAAAGEQVKSDVNISHAERALSAGVGLGMAWLGMKVRGVTGLAMIGGGAALVHRGYTGHCHGYQLLGVNTATAEAPAPSDYHDRGIHLEVACTVQRSPGELYAFWRNFENLPRFMEHLEAVRTIDEKRSHWVAKAPAGRKVEWYAEIINEVPDELIAWRSLANADVDNAGSVRFVDAPGGGGTEVRVVIDYIPPGGRLGKLVATLFGEAPEQTIKEDLGRLKKLMETGQPATV